MKGFNFNKVMKVMDIFPGQKRTLTCFVAIGMLICQSFGFHEFSQMQWGEVGVAGGIFWYLGVLRDNEGSMKKGEVI